MISIMKNPIVCHVMALSIMRDLLSMARPFVLLIGWVGLA